MTNLLRSPLLTLLAAAWFLWGAIPALAQNDLTILRLYSDNFPDLSAEFVLRDGSGGLIRNFSPDDFELTENGVPIRNFTIDCPPSNPARPFTGLLVCDQSGSMSSLTDNGKLRLIELLQRGVGSFIRSVDFTPPTTVGITSFHNRCEIVHDFSDNSTSLLAAIARLTTKGTTRYYPAMADQSTGAIPLLKTTSINLPRYLIFVTDGLPSDELPVTEIVNECMAENIKVYVVTLAMPMFAPLATIAQMTGGAAYEHVYDEATLNGIYTLIAMRAQDLQPCTIRWRSFNGCADNHGRREVKLTYKPRGISATMRYTAPASATITMGVTPELLYFGETVPPASSSREVTLAAHNATFTVTSATIPPDAPFTVVDWGGTPPPFEMPDGTSRTLTIRFTPLLQTISSSTLTFQGTPCPIAPVTLLGGATSVGNDRRLELVSPIGGEVFAGCDSVLIRWTGIPPIDTVVIEYSDNSGAVWKTITTTGTLLEHRWLPPAPGEGYRIRISLRGEFRGDTVRTIAGGGSSLTSDQALERRLSAPSSMAVSGDLLFVAESGSHRVGMVDMKTGFYDVIAGTGQPGFDGDGGPATEAKLFNPAGLAFADKYLYIADQTNHRIRRVDIVTGDIVTVAGTGEPGFEGDGGPAVEAKLLSPSHLIATDDILYITDQGNNRIRRLNLRTRVIQTIAGGGSGPGDDSSPATAIGLLSPAGMALVSDPIHNTDTLYFVESGAHFLRRLDLRSGLVSIVAGTGIGGNSGDGGPAINARLGFPQDVAVAGPNIYIADARNYRVREFNRNTRTIRTVAGSGRNAFAGDGGPALSAAFTRVMAVAWHAPDELVIADFENERIRVVSLGDIGRRDSSDPSFSVAIPILKVALPGRLVEFGNLALDAERDTMLINAACNRGTAPTTLDSITLIGPNEGDFAIVSGPGVEEIAPGACRAIEIRFQPTALGTRRARAILHGSCGNRDTLTLNGIGLNSCGIATLDRKDLGEILPGESSGDVVLSRVICNNGETPQSGKITIDPADGPFTLVAGGGTFTLLPGECRDVTVRFTPQRTGRATATIEYGIPAYCSVSSTLLLGKGLERTQVEVVPEVRIPALGCDVNSADTIIKIGNKGNVPLVITGAELLANNEGFSFTAPAPTGTNPLTIAPGAVGNIPVRFQPATQGIKSATLRITAQGTATPVDVALSGRWDSLRLAADDVILVFNGELPANLFPLDSFMTLRNTGTAPMTITAGSLSGGDAGRFEVPSGQFPVTVAPGDSVRVAIRALGPAAGASYQATLALTVTPECDGEILVDVFESGAGPAIAVPPPTFRDLLCSNETEDETMLVIRNPGGSELRITSYDLQGADAAAFIFAPNLPIIVPPHGEVSISIRFVPPTFGTFSAMLVLASNAPGGDVTVALSGHRGMFQWNLQSTELALGHLMPGIEGTGIIAVRNTGTGTVRIDLPATAGMFRILTPSPLILDPGEDRNIEVALLSTTEGNFLDTIILQEFRCGTSIAIPLSASVFTPAFAEVTLPVDSAGPGSRVSLPVRISIPDRALFDLKGARRYRTIITFNGAILVPVNAPGAQITGNSYDPKTATRRLTLEGEYSGTGDTLALLVCNVPQNDFTGTPLTFEEFTWDTPQVFTTKINGHFTMLDICYDGASLVFRPSALKIRPMPVNGEAVVGIELEEDHTLRVSLVDVGGREIEIISGRRYGAGYHELPLDLHAFPTGIYTLVIATPFGQATERIAIVK